MKRDLFAVLTALAVIVVAFAVLVATAAGDDGEPRPVEASECLAALAAADESIGLAVASAELADHRRQIIEGIGEGDAAAAAVEHERTTDRFLAAVTVYNSTADACRSEVTQ